VEISAEVVSRGVALFGLSPAALQCLGGTDGVVYAGRRAGQDYVIKFVPVDAEGFPSVRERWSFSHYLAQNGVPVARPVLSERGNLIELVQDESRDGPLQWATTLSERAPGGHYDWRGDPERNDAFTEAWGEVMGTMHALSRRYTGGAELPDALDECDSFVRWCHDAFHDPQLDTRWTELRRWMETVPRDTATFGVVHNDLHPENMLVADQCGALRITVIDFDCCVWHWYAADLAVALSTVCWDWVPTPPGMTRQQFVQQFWGHFTTGYRRACPLDAETVALVPAFLDAHRMLLHVVLSQEWGPANSWQRGLLDGWRRGIIAGVPVLARPLTL